MFAYRHLVSLSLVCLMAGAAQAGPLPDRVAKAAAERVAAGQYPVLVIAVVDGDKSQIAAYGVLPDGKPADADTVFEIGSTTKTFTATLLAEAVTKGRVTLDDPVAKLLPDFVIPSRSGKPITLGDIATQRSGLPRMPDNFAPADPLNPYADYTVAKQKEFLAHYTLPRDPGASYEYSNFAFGLLGTALAKNAGTDYRALLRDKLLLPLGMKDSDVVTTAAMRSRLAPGRSEQGKPAKNWDFEAFAGAGAIRSTGNDMLRYLKANMGIGANPLRPAMQLAQTPRAEMNETTHIGLAWMVTNKLGIVWHNGMTGGYASFVGFTADRKHGVVVLTNAAQSVDDLGFATLIAEAPLAATQMPVKLSEQSLKDYEGSYKLAEGFILRIFYAGEQTLYAQATGQGPFQIYPSASNEFFARIAPISISFQRDASGKVTGLVLHQNGDRTAPRLPDEATVTLSAAELQEYVGKYQLAPSVVAEFMLKDGQLFTQLTGQPAFPVFASAKDKLFLKVVDARIDFERDAKGNVIAMVLHQNGQNMRAPRIAP